MAELGKLFYELGVKVSDLSGIDALEERIKNLNKLKIEITPNIGVLTNLAESLQEISKAFQTSELEVAHWKKAVSSIFNDTMISDDASKSIQKIGESFEKISSNIGNNNVIEKELNGIVDTLKNVQSVASSTFASLTDSFTSANTKGLGQVGSTIREQIDSSKNDLITAKKIVDGFIDFSKSNVLSFDFSTADGVKKIENYSQSVRLAVAQILQLKDASNALQQEMDTALFKNMRSVTLPILPVIEIDKLDTTELKNAMISILSEIPLSLDKVALSDISIGTIASQLANEKFVLNNIEIGEIGTSKILDAVEAVKIAMADAAKQAEQVAERIINPINHQSGNAFSLLKGLDNLASRPVVDQQFEFSNIVNALAEAIASKVYAINLLDSASQLPENLRSRIAEIEYTLNNVRINREAIESQLSGLNVGINTTNVQNTTNDLSSNQRSIEDLELYNQKMKQAVLLSSELADSIAKIHPSERVEGITSVIDKIDTFFSRSKNPSEGRVKEFAKESCSEINNFIQRLDHLYYILEKSENLENSPILSFLSKLKEKLQNVGIEDARNNLGRIAWSVEKDSGYDWPSTIKPHKYIDALTGKWRTYIPDFNDAKELALGGISELDTNTTRLLASAANIDLNKLEKVVILAQELAEIESRMNGGQAKAPGVATNETQAIEQEKITLQEVITAIESIKTAISSIDLGKAFNPEQVEQFGNVLYKIAEGVQTISEKTQSGTTSAMFNPEQLEQFSNGLTQILEKLEQVKNAVSGNSFAGFDKLVESVNSLQSVFKSPYDKIKEINRNLQDSKDFNEFGDGSLYEGYVNDLKKITQGVELAKSELAESANTIKKALGEIDSAIIGSQLNGGNFSCPAFTKHIDELGRLSVSETEKDITKALSSMDSRLTSEIERLDAMHDRLSMLDRVFPENSTTYQLLENVRNEISRRLDALNSVQDEIQSHRSDISESRGNDRLENIAAARQYLQEELTAYEGAVKEAIELQSIEKNRTALIEEAYETYLKANATIEEGKEEVRSLSAAIPELKKRWEDTNAEIERYNKLLREEFKGNVFSEMLTQLGNINLALKSIDLSNINIKAPSVSSSFNPEQVEAFHVALNGVKETLGAIEQRLAGLGNNNHILQELRQFEALLSDIIEKLGQVNLAVKTIRMPEINIPAQNITFDSTTFEASLNAMASSFEQSKNEIASISETIKAAVSSFEQLQQQQQQAAEAEKAVNTEAQQVIDFEAAEASETQRLADAFAALTSVLERMNASLAQSREAFSRLFNDDGALVFAERIDVLTASIERLISRLNGTVLGGKQEGGFFSKIGRLFGLGKKEDPVERQAETMSTAASSMEKSAERIANAKAKATSDATAPGDFVAERFEKKFNDAVREFGLAQKKYPNATDTLSMYQELINTMAAIKAIEDEGKRLVAMEEFMKIPLTFNNDGTINRNLAEYLAEARSLRSNYITDNKGGVIGESAGGKDFLMQLETRRLELEQLQRLIERKQEGGSMLGPDAVQAKKDLDELIIKMKGFEEAKDKAGAKNLFTSEEYKRSMDAINANFKMEQEAVRQSRAQNRSIIDSEKLDAEIKQRIADIDELVRHRDELYNGKKTAAGTLIPFDFSKMDAELARIKGMLNEILELPVEKRAQVFKELTQNPTAMFGIKGDLLDLTYARNLQSEAVAKARQAAQQQDRENRATSGKTKEQLDLEAATKLSHALDVLKNKREELERVRSNATTAGVSTAGIDSYISKINELQAKLEQLKGLQADVITTALGSFDISGLVRGASSAQRDTEHGIRSAERAAENASKEARKQQLEQEQKELERLEALLAELKAKYDALSTTSPFERMREELSEIEPKLKRLHTSLNVEMALNPNAGWTAEMQKIQEQITALSGRRDEIFGQIPQEAFVKYESLINLIDEAHARIARLRELESKSKIFGIIPTDKSRGYSRSIIEEEKEIARLRQELETLRSASDSSVSGMTNDQKNLEQQIQATTEAIEAQKKKIIELGGKVASDSAEKLSKNWWESSKAVESFNGQTAQTLKSITSLDQQFSMLAMNIQNAFSIMGLQQFAQELIHIGGELEKHEIAMAAILGSADKAEDLYADISTLSMVSPFTVQDLTKNVKQLAAFGIEYESLYETTKRLSDIAAGVGVDFGRISYEYSQMMAMGYLDRRHLRMFSMSGVPLLQRLQEYYSTQRGEDVSREDVDKMIFKRQIGADVVKNILWEMTDEGGKFFNMQEIMAESLASKYANLENAWNLMLGDMAKAAPGDILKDWATFATELTTKWREVVSTVGTLAAAFGVMKVAQAAYATTNAATAASITNVALAEEARSLELLKAKLATQALTAEEIKGLAALTGKTQAQLAQLGITEGLVVKETSKLVLDKSLNAENLKSVLTCNQLTLAQKRQAIAMSSVTDAEKVQLLVQSGLTKEQAMFVVGTNSASASMIRFRLSLVSVGQFMASNVWTIAIMAVAALGSYIYNCYKEANKLNEALSELDSDHAAELSKLTNGFEVLIKKIKSANTSEEERLATIKKIESQYGEYLDDIAKEALRYGDVEEAATRAKNAIKDKMKMQLLDRKTDAVYDNYKPKIADARKDLESYLRKEFERVGINKGKLSEVASTIESMIIDGKTDSEIENTVRSITDNQNFKLKRVTSHSAAWEVGAMQRLYAEQSEKIAEIERGLGGNPYKDRIKAVEDFWDKLINATQDGTKRTELQIKKAKSLMELFNGDGENLSINYGGQKLDVKKVGLVPEFFKQYKTQYENLVSNAGRLWDQESKKIFGKKSIYDAFGKTTKAAYTKDGIDVSAAIASDLNIREGENMETYFERLAKIRKEQQAELKKYNTATAKESLKTDASLRKRKATTEEELRLINEYGKVMQINWDDWAKESGRGTSERKRSPFEMIDKRFQALQEVRQQLDKWTKLYIQGWTDESGVSHIATSIEEARAAALQFIKDSGILKPFEGLIGDFTDLQGYKREVQKVYEDLEKMSVSSEYKDDKIKKQEEALKLLNLDIPYDIASELAGKIAERIAREMEDAGKKWDFFDTLIESGMNPDIASTVAGVERHFISFADELRGKLKTAFVRNGVTGVTIDELLALDDETIKNSYGVEIQTIASKLRTESENEFKKVSSTIAEALKANGEVEAEQNSNDWLEMIVLTAIDNMEQSDEVKNKMKEAVNKMFDLKDTDLSLSHLFEDTSYKLTAAIREQYKNNKNWLKKIEKGQFKYKSDGTLDYILVDGKKVSLDKYKEIKSQVESLGNETDKATESFRKFWQYVSGKSVNGQKLKFADVSEGLSNSLTSIGKVVGSIQSTVGIFSKSDNSLDLTAIINGFASVINGFGQITSGDALAGMSNVSAGMEEAAKAAEESAEAERKLERDRKATDDEAKLNRLSDAIEHFAEVMEDSYDIVKINESYEKQLEALRARQEMLRQAIKEEADIVGHGERNHSITYNLREKLNSSDFEAIQNLLSEHGLNESVNSVDDLFNLSPEAWSLIKYDLPDLFNTITLTGDNITEQVNAYIASAKELEKIEEDNQKKLLGFLVDDMRSNFHDAMMDMTSDAEDFADSFTESMMSALVDTYVLGDEFQAWLEEWYDELKAVMADKNLTEEEKAERIKRLRQQAADKAAEKKQETELWAEALEWSGDTKNSLSKSISGITDEQADILAAYINGIRADTSQEVSILEQIREHVVNLDGFLTGNYGTGYYGAAARGGFEEEEEISSSAAVEAMMTQLAYYELPTLNVTAEAQLAQLNMIAEHTLAIRDNTAMMAEYMETMSTDIHRAAIGVQPIYVQ